MPGNIIGLMALTSVSIIMFLCVVFSFLYDKTKEKNKLIKTAPEDDWLFSCFHESVYDLMYKKPPHDTMIGLSIEEYHKYCDILKEPFRPKKMIAFRIEGVSILLAFIGVGYSMIEQSLALSVSLICTGVVLAYVIGFMPFASIKNRANERLFKIRDDLPRFLSLLEKALDFSVDQALRITAMKFKSPLSDDMLDTLNTVALGAGGWQDSLVRLADTYRIDAFSDVVLDLINAHEQGMNIRTLVNRKCYEIEQIRLYDVEQHDQKVKSMIYFPIMTMKLLPMLILICYPMLTSASLG